MHYIIQNGHLKVAHKQEVEEVKSNQKFSVQAGFMVAVYSPRRDGGFNMEVVNQNHL